MVEYALILGLIMLACVAVFTSLGLAVKELSIRVIYFSDYIRLKGG